MGGYSSGTWSRWNPKQVDNNFQKLSIKRLREWGYVGQGRKSGSITWSQDGREYASVAIQGGDTEICLIYSLKSDSESKRYPIDLEWTKCHYGGSRPWFRCPRCYGRTSVLYGASLFLCRKCHGLAYQSQRDSRLSRAMKLTDKYEAKLQNVDGYLYRPKGMHQKTFNRITRRLDFGLEEMDCSLSKTYDSLTKMAKRK